MLDPSESLCTASTATGAYVRLAAVGRAMGAWGRMRAEEAAARAVTFDLTPSCSARHCIRDGASVMASRELRVWSSMPLSSSVRARI